MRSTVQFMLTCALMLLFSYAAVSKLSDISLFRAQLYLQPFPHGLADVLVPAIPAFEILTIGLLFLERTRRSGLWLSLALMTTFTAYIALMFLIQHDHLPCSCGGILNRMPWHVHLIFNFCFVVASFTAIWLDRRGRTQGGDRIT
ncbi:MAG: hypothetical protein JKY70_05720 [Mucilaginibacter sp.]|nr:hypothetical protein [Mucilaginibacter sp.]